jgi:hypothetical protein
MKRGQDEGFARGDMPAGLALIIAGALIQVWLRSQVEIRDALAVTGDAMPDDEAFVQAVLDLVRARPDARPGAHEAGRKRT